MSSTQKTAGKSHWRILFWSGLISLMLGTGVATSYISNIFQSQSYLIGGFGLIVFGITLMAIGVLVSKERTRKIK